MNLEQDLIGKLYPVKDTLGNVVKFVPITQAFHIENAAGMIITLVAQNKNFIMISYGEAIDLANQ